MCVCRQKDILSPHDLIPSILYNVLGQKNEQYYHRAVTEEYVYSIVSHCVLPFFARKQEVRFLAPTTMHQAFFPEKENNTKP